jgi:hypothetical protein
MGNSPKLLKEGYILKQYAAASKRTRCLRLKTVKCEAFQSRPANIAGLYDPQGRRGMAAR